MSPSYVSFHGYLTTTYILYLKGIGRSCHDIFTPTREISYWRRGIDQHGVVDQVRPIALRMIPLPLFPVILLSWASFANILFLSNKGTTAEVWLRSACIFRKSNRCNEPLTVCEYDVAADLCIELEFIALLSLAEVGTVKNC